MATKQIEKMDARFQFELRRDVEESAKFGHPAARILRRLRRDPMWAELSDTDLEAAVAAWGTATTWSTFPAIRFPKVKAARLEYGEHSREERIPAEYGVEVNGELVATIKAVGRLRYMEQPIWEIFTLAGDHMPGFDKRFRDAKERAVRLVLGRDRRLFGEGSR